MSEWTPWIEHDGKGCPCFGEFVHMQKRNGSERLGVVRSQGVFGKHSAWIWREGRPKQQSMTEVIRYRIRKPRGLTILENIIADLPVPVAKVDA